MRKIFILSILLLFSLYCYSTEYYVSTTGTDSPSNGLSPSTPWKTIAYACAQVPVGTHRINIAGGTYTETIVMRPKEGVSVKGAGVDITIVRFGVMSTDNGAFDLRSEIVTQPGGVTFTWEGVNYVYDRKASGNGNQEISHLTMDGINRSGYEGVRVTNRNNVKIHDIKVINFANSGLSFETQGQATISNTEVYNFTIKESAYEGNNQSLGNITIRGDYNNFIIRDGIIEHLTNASGYGIKAMRSWWDYVRKGDYMRNVKIYNLQQNGKANAQWAGGLAANIGIEFWNINADGVEIRNSNLTNAISMEFNAPLVNYTYSFWVHHNNIKVPYAGIGETAASNIIFEYNYIDYRENANAWSVFGEFNSGNNTLTPGVPIQNLRVNNNIFDLGTRQPSFFVFTSKVQDIKFYNNTINATSGTPTLFELRRPYANGSNSFKVVNNIFDFEHAGAFKMFISGGENFDGNPPANSIFKNNMYRAAPTNLPSTFAQSGNILATASLKRTGARNDTYFQPGTGSNVIDQGIDVGLPYTGTAPDIGRFEGTGGVADTQAPTAPTNLSSPSKTSNSVSLSWTASTDNIGVTSYDIYQGAIVVGSTTTTTSFTATGLTPSTTYSFSIKAKDAAGNTSAQSSSLSVTTNAESATWAKYEAEASVNILGGTGSAQAYVTTCTTCSNAKAVYNIGNNAGSLQFNNISSTGGSRSVKIYYLNGDAVARTGLMSINGGTATSLNFPPTGSWSTVGFITVTVTLNNGGTNNIKFYNIATKYAPNFDYIDVSSTSGARIMKEEVIEANFKEAIYPNPVYNGGNLNISLKEFSNKNVIIKILDNAESVRFSTIVSRAQDKLSLPIHLNSGVYFVLISDGKTVKSTRLIVR